MNILNTPNLKKFCEGGGVVYTKAIILFSVLIFSIFTIPGFSQMAQAAPEPKITICHLPPGNPENIQTITVGESAVQAHLDHGDEFGDCETDFALITVTKNVVNDDDGDKDPSDFTMIVNNSDNEIVTFPGSSGTPAS